MTFRHPDRPARLPAVAGAVPAGFRARQKFSRLFRVCHTHLAAICIVDCPDDGWRISHATAIEAREKAAPKPKAAKPKRRKRGRPRKGEARAKEPSRLGATDDEPSAVELPSESGLDRVQASTTADGGIPIACIMTSASTHDSQVRDGNPDGRAGREPLRMDAA